MQLHHFTNSQFIHLSKDHVFFLGVIQSSPREGEKNGVQLTATILGAWEQTAREENVTERKPD